jgi:hypothetical protein
MIRKTLSQFVKQITTGSTPEPSTSSSTKLKDDLTPSYEDILEARRHAVRWHEQAHRINELLEQTERRLAQLAVDRRLAYEMKKMSRLATLDSDRLEDEAYVEELKKLLMILTGTKARAMGEALVRHVSVAISVTYELEASWLQLKELEAVARTGGYLGLHPETTKERVEASRRDFYTSVSQLVTHLNAVSPLSYEK